jgi:hypothetical protein
MKRAFFKAEITPGRLKQITLLKIKNAPQNISPNFFVSGFFHKNFILKCAFDENLSVTHVFIDLISMTCTECTPIPSNPTGLCRGWGL